MIITVTMNPAIDKTAYLEDLRKGALNRISSVVYDAGGKGINVSKTIRALGGETLASGFMGRNGSDIIYKCLEDEGIKYDFVTVNGQTRTNMKLVTSDGELTEINEAGPAIDKGDMERLINKLSSYAGTGNIFILAGSVPAGADTSVYAELVSILKASGSAVIVDAEGEIFEKALKKGPDIVKPNVFEVAKYFKCDHEPDEKELLYMGQSLIDKGVRLASISRGGKGAMFFTKNKICRCSSLNVKVNSTVGAGDGMVAALAYAYDKGMSFEESIRLSMAVSAGAVTTIGTKPPSKELVYELMDQVEIETIQDCK